MSTVINQSDHDHLSHAARLATANVLKGGGPFGAVVVTADGRAFEGVNRVTANNDPTAHAEVTAIRTACSQSGTFDLTGATLYTSCEPCPMCLASALWARVDRVVFAADRHDAADAGFDDAVFYEFFETPSDDRPMKVEHLVLADSGHLEPFTTWGSFSGRIEY
jgi:guanine deaminase